MPSIAQDPAAGAPGEDLIPALIVAAIALILTAVLAVTHRRGKTQILTKLATFGESVSGLPGWAALPSAIAGTALLVAVFGFYWDVATHIDNGRDPGPFANPSHYLIIGGLAGIALAGMVGVLLGRDKDESSVRFGDGWHVSVGCLLLLICGGIAVAGFPLDDVWHRLFGQDVTLWSPTHIQMVGGASLSTLAMWVLVVEWKRARPLPGWMPRVIEYFVAGSFLIGLSALQAEFDYSVPQFRLLYHPVLLMATAGIALVAARIRLGRGGALVSVGVFLLIRGILSVVIGPVMGHTTLHFPLFIVEALAVEAVALKVPATRVLRFGLIAGAAIGTVGLAAEWAWSQVWMTMSWPASLFPQGALFGLAAALSGAVIGALIGQALSDPGRLKAIVPRPAALAAAAILIVVIAYPFRTTGELPGAAALEVTPTQGQDGWGQLEVQLDPPRTANDSEWLVLSAWQGGGSVVEEMESMGEGRYVAPDPIPLSGDWKTLIRLHDGNALAAIPVYLPEDPAIPAEGVEPPAPGEKRPFSSDKKLLLREAKEVDQTLTTTASSILALIVVAWIAAIAWGLKRTYTARSVAPG